MGKKKRWECWTLSEEDIDEIIKENDLRKPSKEELEKIAAEFKKNDLCRIVIGISY